MRGADKTIGGSIPDVANLFPGADELRQTTVAGGSIADVIPALGGITVAEGFTPSTASALSDLTPLEGPTPLADVSGKLDDEAISDIVGQISKCGISAKTPVHSGGSSRCAHERRFPSADGQAVTSALAEQLGPEVGDQVGEAVTGALGGMLEAGGEAGEVGSALIGAVDNVMNGESPAAAVRSALDEAGFGEYGEVAERAITVAEKIADGDFAAAAEAAGLDDELDPLLGAAPPRARHCSKGTQRSLGEA